MRRIQALPRQYPGIEELSKGNVLSDELDPELEALCLQASRELGVPVATVSLVLEDTTFLRASHGLPADARVTDRDASFCQFVVRDGLMLEVNDAAHDTRMPSESATELGVAAYLGAPLVIHGKTVGSMCAIDNAPRLFDDRERGILHRLALKASLRLSSLAMEPRDLERTLHDRAVRPAFGEIRNRLQPVLGNIAGMQAVLDQILGYREAMKSASPSDKARWQRFNMDELLGDLGLCLEDMASDAGSLHRSIVAVERASLISEATCSIHDIIEPATTLAHHRTKLVDGVTWTGQCRLPLRVPRSVAVNALAAALAGIAGSVSHGSTRGIAGLISSGEDMAIVELTADVEHRAIDELALQLASLIGDSSQVRVRVRTRGLQLGFATVQVS